MGSNRGAKLMLKGIPTVPGYMGEDQSNEAFIKAAQEIGFPIMVKASAGGAAKVYGRFIWLMIYRRR